ncbi:MAG: phosphoribosylformylglycinamidine cyclo-ligase [Herpetosiphon sp.]
MSYKAAGVDIDAATRAKDLMTAAVRGTHTPAVVAGMGAFGGVIDLSAACGNLAMPMLVASTDGVGTKTLVAAALSRYDTVGQDLVNHCLNDVLVQGARPLFCMDYIAAAQLDPQMVATVVGGVATACQAIGCALLGGETAEMPDVYIHGAFDLAATMVGVVSRDRLITGRSIQPGDVVLGLPSNGLHTNGYSLARRICEPLGYASCPAELGGQSIGEALLAIHRPYLREVEALWQAGVEIKGMAHITGGGLLENLPRTLPPGCGAVIHVGSWPVPPIITLLVDVAHLPQAESFRALNMGVGMALIVAEADAPTACALLPELCIIGAVTAGHGISLA